MTEKDFEDVDRKTINELLSYINPKFFDWAREVAKFNVIRAVELNTFLLNFSIYTNYIP